GVLCQRNDEHSRDSCQLFWSPGFNYTCFGRCTFRNGPNDQPGESTGDVQHPALMDYHAALCGADWWNSLRGSSAHMNLTAINTFSRKLAEHSLPLRHTKTEVLQINVGKLCNLT